jgi:endonuclease-3
MTERRAEEILEIMRRTFTMPKWPSPKRDLFKTLIVTIISQNTADRNTTRAFENLSKHFRITPEALANARTDQIEDCLKPAGLYRTKAKTIKLVSKIMLEKHHGNLEFILSMSFEDARKALMDFPGVGPKTADVVLLFSAEKSTIPVDTHVERTSKRLGLASANGDYETVRKSLQSLYDPKDYLTVHVLLISHGRKYCTARNPLCKQCPVNALCPSRYLWDRND